MKKSIAILIVLTLAFLVLAACGSNGTQAAQAQSTPAAESSAVASADVNTSKNNEKSEVENNSSTESKQEDAPEADDVNAQNEPEASADPEPEASKPEGNSEVPEDPAPNEESEPAEPETPEDPEVEESQEKVLVVYFSATGTTRGVAKKIAAVTGGDLYEILPAEPYTSEDLNWNDKESRSTKEQNDKSSRPAIGSNRIDVSAYSTIYIGFPIWWGEEPRIMDTFVESYKFNGITLVPFCTSGGSGIGRSGPNMEALAGSGTWLDGKRFSSGVSESELQSWIDGLQ